MIIALLPKTAKEVGTHFSSSLAIPETASGTMEVLLCLNGNDLKDPEVFIVFGIEIFRAGEWVRDAEAAFKGGGDNTEQPGFFVEASGYAGKTIRGRFTTSRKLAALSLTVEY